MIKPYSYSCRQLYNSNAFNDHAILPKFKSSCKTAKKNTLNIIHRYDFLVGYLPVGAKAV